MKNLISVFLIIIISMINVFSQTSVQKLRVENLISPIGLDIVKPRFSWILAGDKRNTTQTAYEIRVAKSETELNSEKNLVWNSGKVPSGESVHVTYSGPTLQSGTRYFWKVKVWDNTGKASKWSEVTFWQTGIFDKSLWKAKWIVPGYPEDTINRPCPYFRKQFDQTKKISSATLYITSHGLYEASINGKRVGDAYLTPGWTSYKKRLQYQVYDVTGQLNTGPNVIGIKLGNGWYRGIIGFSSNINVYGKDIALLLQLEIKYSDGTSETVISDESWKTSTGEIIYSEIYNGETVDARLEKKDWNRPGFNDSGWENAKSADFTKENLVGTYNEPVRKKEIFKPVKVFSTPKGEKVIDFGQNLVGWVKFNVKGKAGDKITISHAEVLDKFGNFYTENLRAAKAQDNYILKGGIVETFEPHFTWHGFRYIKIEDYPGEVNPSDFEAIAFYSDMSPTGEFSCSNPLINQLQHNIQWGQRGNFLDIPTDCPQRDERLGWTGDAQAFSRTAAFNMNVNNFFAKWLQDLEADQVNGAVPYVIPNVLGQFAVNSAGWADAATIVPWNIYLAYGDKAILENQYQSMKTYVENIRAIAKDNLWNTGFHFGDWLFYSPEDDNDGRAAVTDKYLITQCFYANSVQLLINAAKVLGKTDDVNEYSALLAKIKSAFMDEYVTKNGRLVSGTQTAYVLALNFDMLPDELRKQAADRLVKNINDYGTKLTTGFLGTPNLCHVLTRFGHSDLAYKLLLQEKYPSWLYPVKMGATTIWERWDGIKPDSTFEAKSMNSFNHYAYGAIGDWMYRVMAGINTYEDAPGYKHSFIKPVLGGGFTNVSASIQTYYGKLSSAWSLDSDKIEFNVEIPANTNSTIYIPTKDVNSVTENGKPVSDIKAIISKREEPGYLVLELGSGKYSFRGKY